MWRSLAMSPNETARQQGGEIRISAMGNTGPSANERRSSADHFATTHWSLVLAAGSRRHAEADQALERLCRQYWPPLYAYVRRRVSDVHEAQDLTQAFFERLLEKQFLTQADPARGRFRAFLITAFQHFLANEWDKTRTQKRGGHVNHLAFDFAAQDIRTGELSNSLTPERVYERQWAIALLNRVMDRLQRDMERNGQARQFQILREFIGGSGESSYAAPAAELGMTESAARMAASRLRGRYRELLKEEISHTVSSPAEVDDEIRQLFAAVSS
jgi:RNA polymerase sigma factor (sigma-70 family)